QMRLLSQRKVNWKEAMGYFMGVICQVDDESLVPEKLPNERGLRLVQELYDGRGRGSELESADGTAWGLLSAVTEFVDHHKQARNNDNRLDSAWFGQGAQ